MNTCFRCGAESSKLFNVIAEEGIISVCSNCLDNYETPLVEKPSESIFQEPNKKKSVYERLGSFAGINLNEHKPFEKRKEEKINEQDKELMEIVKKNVLESPINLNSNNYLVKNFHWYIMRARRLKKLTLSEISRKISEPEEVLKLIESGTISERSLEVIKKLEVYLDIQILAAEGRKKLNSLLGKRIGFDSVSTQILTIDDLVEMKKKREQGLKKDNVNNKL